MQNPSRTRLHARRRHFPMLLVCLPFCLGACASSPEMAAEDPGMPADDGLQPGGVVLRHADIEEMGVRDAMQVVERASTFLKIQRTREGTPHKITQRGVTSFLLSPEILVVIDGARVQTVVQHLRSIPAESIAWIQILNGREASARFGTEASNGVILVRTSADP